MGTFLFLSLKLGCKSFEPKDWLAICITWENSYVSQFAWNVGIFLRFGVGKDHRLRM